MLHDIVSRAKVAMSGTLLLLGGRQTTVGTTFNAHLLLARGGDGHEETIGGRWLARFGQQRVRAWLGRHQWLTIHLGIYRLCSGGKLWQESSVLGHLRLPRRSRYFGAFVQQTSQRSSIVALDDGILLSRCTLLTFPVICFQKKGNITIYTLLLDSKLPSKCRRIGLQPWWKARLQVLHEMINSFRLICLQWEQVPQMPHFHCDLRPTLSLRDRHEVCAEIRKKC